MRNSYETFHALCQSRRSHRKFSPEPVPEEMIAQILETAATSPFASGRKNWKILVIRDRDVCREMVEAIRRQTEQMAADMEPEMATMFRRYVSNFAQFADAPVLLLPVFRVAPMMRSLLRDRLTPPAMLGARQCREVDFVCSHAYSAGCRERDWVHVHGRPAHRR